MGLAEIIVFGIGFLIVAVAVALFIGHSSLVLRLLSAGVAIGMIVAGALLVLFLVFLGSL